MNTKYRIAFETVQRNRETGELETINLDNYDLVIKSGRFSHGWQEYEVIKNTTDLSDNEIADICDRNNFGYTRCGNLYRIYTD